MNESRRSVIQDVIDNGYSFNFGDYMSRGIDLFKQNVGGFAIYTLVYFLIVMVLSLIPILGAIGTMVISPALAVGFYIVAHKIAHGQSTEFKDFFKGFDHLGQLFLLAFIMGIIFIVLMGVMIGPFMMMMMTNPEALLDGRGIPQFKAWWFAPLVLVIYLSISWRWAPLFIVFDNMGFWEAMETSRKVVSKNWFIIFAFAIVIGLLGGLGIIALLIGILFTYPMVLCMEYAAFADVTRLDEAGGDDEITDHLVD